MTTPTIVGKIGAFPLMARESTDPSTTPTTTSNAVFLPSTRRSASRTATSPKTYINAVLTAISPEVRSSGVTPTPRASATERQISSNTAPPFGTFSGRSPVSGSGADQDRADRRRVQVIEAQRQRHELILPLVDRFQ